MINIGNSSMNTDLIYEAALRPQRWPFALKHFCEELSAEKAHLIYIEKNYFYTSFSSGYGYNPDLLEISAASFRRYFSNDPIARYGVCHIDKVFSDRRVVDPIVLHNSEMQRNIRDKANMEYMLTAVMDYGSDEWAIINFHRPRSGVAFDESNERALQEYIPHFKRAASIQKSLNYSGNIQSLQATILNNVALPILVINDKHQVIAANSAAEKLITYSNLIDIKRGLVVCRNPKENIELSLAINKAIHSKDNTQTPVKLSNFDDIVYLVTSPLIPSRHDEMREEYLLPDEYYTKELSPTRFALVTLYDPSKQNTNKSSLFVNLFGLTEAEAALANCLLEDKTLQEAAKTLGRSVNTARVQLQTIFEKTNTNRQSSLIKLLDSLP